MIDMRNEAKECLSFIEKSVSCFHAVQNMEALLKEHGYTELKEKEKWEIAEGCGYYVKRNDSSIIAFRMPQGEPEGFHIMESHSDSPAFKVKSNPEITVEGNYIKLSTEAYGGMIHAS